MNKKLILLLIFQSSWSFLPAQKTTLNHIAIYVVNLEASTSFYSNIVGLDTIANPFNDGKHTWFSVGQGSHLHLIEGAKAKRSHDKNSHLCFSVPSVEEFSMRLQKSSIPYESWTGEKMKATLRVDGVQQIYFEDPDGYWIEINDAKE